MGEISKELKVIKKELDSLEVNRSTKLGTGLYNSYELLPYLESLVS